MGLSEKDKLEIQKRKDFNLSRRSHRTKPSMSSDINDLESLIEDKGRLYICEQIPFDGTVKIGITTQTLERRLQSLQTANPNLLEMTYYGPEVSWYKRYESALLSALSKYRIRGEWFKLDDDLYFSLRQNIEEDMEYFEDESHYTKDQLLHIIEGVSQYGGDNDGCIT